MIDPRPTLAQLEQTDDFIRRHIGPRGTEIADMLNTLGIGTLDDLIDKAVPSAIRADIAALHPAATESEVLARLKAFAQKNKVFRSMIGLGYHDCITPAVIARNVFENPGWYTAYTPYQPEISQGRLEALLAFQQMVIDLTGLDIANASLLDEGTAAAEAMTLMKRVAKAKGNTLLVDASCHPQTIAVLETRARPLGLEVRVDAVTDGTALDGVFGVLIQYPATDGALRDPAGLAERVHAAEALLTVAADPLALVVLTPPGEWGADVVVGSAQRFGVPLGFGGPHAAFMATRDAYMRSLPGRLVGVSIDRAGRPAMRLALQTREQHIRRDKATSNICTAQVLLAVMAAFYAIYHGPDGLRTIANRVHRLTAILAAGLKLLGAKVIHDAFFDTLTVAAGSDAPAILERARAVGINLRDYGDGRVGIALDETTGSGDIEELWTIVSGQKGHGLTPAALDPDVGSAIPETLRRSRPILTHPVFNSYHSETEMLRYLHALETKDIALNQSMIPLGSCTMKLNATTEMIPVTWPEFARIHPFAPDEQTIGYRAMISDLSQRLTELTGFAAVSLQPNAGSQGEYSGLLAIRKYHDDRGESGRTICLIPSSAHGTNPASAIMANFKVVVVECDRHGNIDLDDLKSKTQQYRETLGALMVTYPSTHGVFESQIREICTLVHDAGGQVYMDGANFNAMVGICLPGAFGPDVAHLNLHKTFCIPHGGGGPGIGPIGVASHLAPYLPNHPLAPQAGPATGVGPIAAAPWGSAGILPITWAYLALMGDAGLRRASTVAILNANYIAKRLDDYFPVLYKGESGLVAHECIIDVRGLKESAHVTVEDIAKRLMDFGFHAPTMSWPVAGTLMIEPTESESKGELDRFCEAMIAIRGEAARIENGEWPADDNPLHNAPHTADMLTTEDWHHPYSRADAAFPVATLRSHKYWPPVGRIDNAYGDRHIVCTCPAVDSYRDAAE